MHNLIYPLPVQLLVFVVTSYFDKRVKSQPPTQKLPITTDLMRLMSSFDKYPGIVPDQLTRSPLMGSCTRPYKLAYVKKLCNRLSPRNVKPDCSLLNL